MSEVQNGRMEEVLTLPEAASYLRVAEAELQRLAESHDIPAQQIGGEWRFLKKALGEWLRFGRDYSRESRRSSWMFEHPLWEEMLFHLEKRLLEKLDTDKEAQRGTKSTVLKHFGIFRNDNDLEEVLANIQASRKAADG